MYRSWCAYAVSGQAWARSQYLNHQLLNDAVNHMVLTSQCAEDIEDVPMEVCGAMEGGDEELEAQGSTKPIRAMRGTCMLTIFCMWINRLTCMYLL